MENYYEILGVSPQDTQEDIKKVYRKLAKKYHPDVVKDDPVLTKKMYQIQEAYHTIGEEEKRKEYDERLKKSRFRQMRENGINRMEDDVQEKTGPDMSQFERFFGFQAGKGMETYGDQRQNAGKANGPIKPEEMFKAFFKTGK